ncbi:MAG: hypothetical protein A3G23_05520 [Bacteroidetes bacterium RIFCSPLOWO2_12_FULL_37_12]|nr:MAG: hypothetical protein A3G23_05520 [Bacteroidetes bacterium RIFCSPLOWO2_12_FULL_37_12]
MAGIRFNFINTLLQYSVKCFFYIAPMKSIPVILAFTLYTAFAAAQVDKTKTYFDKSGIASSESSAYYYREKAKKKDNYKSFYVLGKTLYFEGKILKASYEDENKNVYAGTCTWYYKNGNKKAVRTFTEEGIENGTTFLYYESGKIWKEIEYADGKAVKNSYKEYTEDGQASRIYEEEFDNNNNDWDLYKSDKSAAQINDGMLSISSFTSEGTSRYVSFPGQLQEFILEANMSIQDLKEGEHAGILFGFKDWQNYSFFSISSGSFNIGSYFEGVSLMEVEGMYSSAVNNKAFNNIKILSIGGENNIYSINGEIQYKGKKTRSYGSKIGFAVSGKSVAQINKLILKEIDLKGQGLSSSNEDMSIKSSGSGLIFSASGYIITNHHVIENADKIMVDLQRGGISKTYKASIIQKDAVNDLAIIKIEDENFTTLSKLRYAFLDKGGLDVGASVFTIGYPLALSGMGKEPKFTDGKISSKTGYNNALNTYQTSIPVQPGSSGSPLFNKNGQFIGIINAKIMDADNVSYAIKLNYIKNIIDLLPDIPELPNDGSISELSLEEKVKILSGYIVFIKIK